MSLRIPGMLAAVLCSASAFGAEAEPLEKPRPNILLIVADDLGYSDLGCYGGEIRTPHIDALAASGFRATDFHAAPSCSPTRSMMLTGTDNHIVGLGNMGEWSGPGQRGKPGYEGHLNHRAPCVATLLRDAGYFTCMAGKWHLGEKPDEWPAARGFERDFTMLPGAGSHWADRKGLLPTEAVVAYTRDGRPVDQLSPGHYSSKDFTDFIIARLKENAGSGKPFFSYLAYQAPHGPLAAPDDWIDRYQGRYDKGYDALRADRLARQKELGIVSKEVVGFPRLPTVPAWDSLSAEQRRLSARKMEVYAAMVECMDDQIGRLIAFLKETGQYENTLIVFLSDNGAAGEDLGEMIGKLAPTAREWFAKTYDNRLENIGRPGSCTEYGPAWAQVGSVPFRLFKGVVANGGIRVPLIVSGAGVQPRGGIHRSLLHVMDLAPTFLEVAGVKHPSLEAGSRLAEIQGRSLVPLLSDKKSAIRSEADWLGWELFGNRAIRQGDWKLLHLYPSAGGSGDWELFDLKQDPAELNDLSTRHPEKRGSMLRLWEEYVKRNGLILTSDGPYAPRSSSSAE